MSKYPDGMIDHTDEGNLHFAVYIKDGVVIIDFGKDLSWIGLPKEHLEAFIAVLKEKLEQL